MGETFDEVVEKLRRETRLSEQIEELTGYVDAARKSVPRLLHLFSGEQLAVLRDQLRELRARRVAMRRKPDDEANAPTDMCCCNVCLQGAPARQFRDGCPLHPAPHLQPGFRADADERLAALETAERVLRVSPSDEEALALCAQLEHHRETLRELVDEQGADVVSYEKVCGVLYRREPWLFEAPGEPRLKPECTGVSARWCPVHGDCTCAEEHEDLNEPDCPLHGTASNHAEAPPDPEAIAQRLMRELGPDLAVAACVQLLGRLRWKG